MSDIQVRNIELINNLHTFIKRISMYLHSVVSSGNSLSFRDKGIEEDLLLEYNKLCGLTAEKQYKDFLDIPLKHLARINDDYFSTKISVDVNYGNISELFSKTIYESLLLNEKENNLITIRDIFPLSKNEIKSIYNFNGIFDNYISISEEEFNSLNKENIKLSLINKMISKTKNNNKDKKPIIAICTAIGHSFSIIAIPNKNTNSYSLKLLDSSHYIKNNIEVNHSKLNSNLKKFFLSDELELINNNSIQKNNTCYAFQASVLSCLFREIANSTNEMFINKLQCKDEITNDIMKQVAIGYFLPTYKEKEKKFTSFINRLNEIQKKNNKEIDVNNIKKDLLADRFIVKDKLDDVVKNITSDYINNNNSSIQQKYLNKKINNIKEEVELEIAIKDSNLDGDKKHKKNYNIDRNANNITNNNTQENISTNNSLSDIIAANDNLMTEYTKTLLRNFANKHKKSENKQDKTL